MTRQWGISAPFLMGTERSGRGSHQDQNLDRSGEMTRVRSTRGHARHL